MDHKLNYEYALKEIRRNMHDPRGPKAAVMVGAGFSRNADPIGGTGQKEFPDWAALTKILVERLYTDPDEQQMVLDSAGATSSAMRLAQEFESAHGRPALIDVVRESIPDDDFVPSILHEKLMDLSWADVFTTNYDTLLERTVLQRSSQTLRVQRYETVLTSSDLPLARRPRIVKLHGTIPDLTNLILTEDDFRRYPIDHAPFVNAVRASLTENIFCLIGFSGDDPNFLAWTGWIRDVLKKSSPPIYLFIGSSIKPFQRKLLEQRNVIPIPIRDISRCEKFDEAFTWLFGELAKPLGDPTANWNLGPRIVESNKESNDSIKKEPFSAKDPKNESLIDAAILWRRHRLQYRGWHVLYRQGITQLWSSTEFWAMTINSKVAEEWSPQESVFILREYVWRYARALQPLPDDLVEHVIDPSLERYAEWISANVTNSVSIVGHTDKITIKCNEINEAFLHILLELLRHAREIGDASRFESIKSRINSTFESESVKSNRDERHFVKHQHALWVLSRFEHDNARSILRNWHTTDADNVWTIRRAGLMLECGEREGGSLLLNRVLDRISMTHGGAEVDYGMRSAEGLVLHLLWYCSHAEDINARSQQAAVRNAPQLNRDPKFDIETKPQKPSGFQRTSPEKAAIHRRLRDLGELGCDPYELLDWLQLKNENKLPPQQKGVENLESFEVGKYIQNSHSNNPEPFRNAYRAIRFIEEAGLPLTIYQVVGIIVAQTLYCNAARVIANEVAQEGIGLALRSRDIKLIESFLSRDTLTKLNTAQLQMLMDVGLKALRRAVDNLGEQPEMREDDDQWWERQLGLATAILSRIVVCVEQQEVDEIATEAINLASNKHIWHRFSISDKVGELIKRSMKSLSSMSIERLLPNLFQVPIPGSQDFPIRLDQHDRWYDPLVEVKLIGISKKGHTRPDINKLVSSLLEDIQNADGKYREHLVIRANALCRANLLTKQQQKDYTDALFSKIDNFGFPVDTRCYDSLILSLPRLARSSEKTLFVGKYIGNEQPDDEYWDNLKRTVNRFGPPHESKSRSIKWSRTELTQILDASNAWLPNFQSQVEAYRERIVNHGSLFSLLPGKQYQYAYRNWLDVMEDVVLLAPNVTNGQIARAVELLDRVSESGLEPVKIKPTLVCLEQVQSSNAISSIAHAIGNRDDSVVWQACCAIRRWSELTREGYKTAIPETLLATLGTLVAARRHQNLPLLINTAKDVIDILGLETSGEFIEQLVYALELLESETSYDPSKEDYLIGQKISIRIACVKLASSLRNLDMNYEPIQKWMNIAENDFFSEVRHSL